MLGARRTSLALCVVFALSAVELSVAATAPPQEKPRSLPHYFEANRGQWPSSEAFRAYGYGYSVSLRQDGLALKVASPRDARVPGKMNPSTTGAFGDTAPREVSLRFEGASAAARLTGLDELDAKGAWFQGAESNWHSGIPLFERVRESQVYAGVDATFYGRDGQLEYDLDVAPRAKTGALIFDLEGADSVTVGKNGDLMIKVDGQQIVLHKPTACQPDGQGRKTVNVSYLLLPADGKRSQRIGLNLKGYDSSKPLTIDPVLTFATYLTSTATLPDYYVVDLAIDSSNNVYVLSTDQSYQSMTVQKFTSAASLVYTATFSSTGGSNNLYPVALRVNASGQAYVAASDRGGYPTTSNGYKTSYPNASYGSAFSAAFSVISANGSSLIYSTYFGGSANGAYGPDYAFALAVDTSGSAYLAGQAGGGNFPTTTGAYQTTYTNGFPAGFVAKFNPSASGTASLVYSTLLGGQGTNINGVSVDGSGDAYLAIGNPQCTYDVPTTAGALSYSGLNTSNYCGYVTSVNPSGTALTYSAYVGPGTPTAVAVDGSKNAYVTGGGIYADDFPTSAGAYQSSYPDGFALELNSTGGLVYSTFLSGPSGVATGGKVYPTSIALVPGCASACTAYISGQTLAPDFPVVNGVGGAPPNVGQSNNYAGFLTAINGTGTAAVTSGYVNGLTSFQEVFGNGSGYMAQGQSSAFTPHVAVDTSGNAWLAGTTYNGGPDFPVTTTTPTGPNGSWLAEVSMTNAGNVIAVPNSVNFGTSIPVDVSSTVYDTANAQPPTTVVLRNMGSAPVTFTAVGSPSYFAETDNCNGQIPAASYCTATIAFTPPNDTPVTGTLTVTSNGLNPSQVIPLSGQGADAAFVQATPASLSFGNQTINTTSAGQTITLTNMGDEPAGNLNLVYFNPAVGFNTVSNCPAFLPPGNSCQVQVTFAPNSSEVGIQTSTLYSPSSGYYSVAVSGAGVLPSGSGGTQSVALSATALNFGTEAVGAASGAQTVYLTNTGSQPLNFLAPTITLTSSQGSAADFQVSSSGGVVAPQAYTSSSVTFTPSVAATETATLTFPVAGSSTVYAVSLVGQGAANTQTLEFQPGNAIFPDQPVGTASAAQNFYLFNAGNTPFVVSRVLGSGDFSVTSNGCSGANLAPATAPGDIATSYCSVSVVFTPSQTGPRSGTLTVIDAASSTPQTIPLAGNGITAAGIFTATPAALGFGTLVKGTSSSAQYVTLTNSGNVPINFISAATTGDYAITNNGCPTPYTIPPGTSNCQIGITFTPMATTGSDNGTLVLTTSAGVQTITLTGGGEAGTLASGLSPTSINFGSYQVNQTTMWVPVYVRNSGTEPLTFSTAATVTGNFTIYTDNCNSGGSGTLAPGQDCSIWVDFAPMSTGPLSGTLTVKSNAGTLTASLSGTGAAVSTTPSYFNPPEVSFDQQAVKSISAPVTVNFYYGGSNPSFALTGATITAGSANFALATGANSLNTCSASQGSTTSCQVNVVFSPGSAGYETGTLTVTSNLGSFAAALSGYAPPVSDTGYLSPSALEFPSQTVTTVSTYQQIYLYNSGASAFTVGTVGGTNFGSTSEFQIYSTVDYCSGQMLAPADSQTSGGGSCYVYVQFAPSGAGTRTGTVTFPVTYADGTTGTFTANLTGIGVAQKNEAVLSPTLGTFPDTAVGGFNTSYIQYFYLTNSGNLPFTVGQLTSTNVVIGSTSTGDFTTASPYGYDSCSNTTVAAGSSCNIYAYFQPGSAGAKTGTVNFPVTYANTTTPVTFTATLKGNGIAVNPAVTLSPAGIQFDSVTVNAGVSTNYQTVTVTNTGNVPLTFTKATVSSGFGIYSDNCTGVTVNPGNSCPEYVYFNPTTTGSITGSLSIYDNAPGSPQKVALSGTSIAATAELQFSQTTVSFGNQLLSTPSNQLTILLINRGTNAVTVNSIALAGTAPADYTESDSCAGYNLAANSSCPIYLTFTPTATGSRTATLTETDSGSGGPRTINISGTGVNASTAITFFPAALTFSSTQPVGEGTPQQFFSVTNIGVNPVTISAVSSTNATVFPVAQDGCTGNTLSTGQSCLIVVLFTPASAAAATGYITVTDNASGSPQKLPVSGTGIAQLTSAVTLTATPTSGAFGTLFKLSAAVKDQNSGPVTNGSVAFYDGATLLGTAQVVTTTSGGGVVGTATLKTILVPLGSNSITAKYAGADATSTSSPVAVTVTGKYPTTTTFTSSGSAGNYTFTGIVLGMGPVNPTGSILFTDNTTGLQPGTATINSATLTETLVGAPPVTVPNPPYAVGLADLNGDGIPDLVTGATPGLYLQFGNGDGTFQSVAQISGESVPSTGIAFGDFNGDGKADIAFIGCANSFSNCAVGVLLGNGDGTFQKERYFDSTSEISGIAVGDFNGDGIQDIAAANNGSGTVDLMLGNGDGSFQEPLSISMPGAGQVAAADLNGDGKLDLVVTNYGYGTVSVLLGNGGGTFQPAASYSTPVSSYPNDVALASLRSNGKLDIVLLDYDNGVSVLLGNGNGTFQPSSPVYSPSSPSLLQNIALADVNGDGKPDLVVTDSGRVEVSVLNGNGDGTFQSPNSYPTGATPFGVAISDMNHDGRPDIAVANNGGPSDTILLNQVTQTATLTSAVVPGTGTHSVSGTYSGDTKFATSTSNALKLAASLVTPSMQLTGVPSSTVAWGQALSVKIALTGPLSFVPTPTGTVSYSIDSATAQTATLSGGVVTIPISQLSVGSHSIAVSYGGDQYYAKLSAQTLPLTVTKANQTINFTQPANVTYGAAPITLTASATSGLSVTFTVASGPATITNNVLTITGAGTIKVVANQAGNVDYNAAPTVTQSFSVAQAPLSVTVNSASKVYGAALPTFSGTVTGLVNGDTVTTTYSSTGTASSAVGTYPINATVAGTAAPNYAVTVVPGTLTITKAMLTVTATNASRAYGTANPAFTDTITGFVNGDTLTAASGTASLTTTATTTSTVGTYPITAAPGTLAASNYTFTFVNGTLTITQATPTITWAAPAAITYGTALSATQLNATSAAAGTFAYTPAAGTVLKAGAQTLCVTFTPTDTTDYTTSTNCVSILVNRATPAITWANPAPISYGTALGSTQLDATASVAGTFAYTPAAGTVLKAGSQTLSVTFTPTDTADYTTATATATLMVNKATPVITWAPPTAITYGTALGSTQLDATASVAGTFVYTPAAGTVLKAGSQTLSVTFTPTDTTDYTTATATATLTVNKATLTVMANNASRAYGAANPTLTDTITGFVNGDTVTVVTGAASLATTATTTSPVSTYPITASLGTLAASNYSFTFVNGTLTITQATPTITWATPAAITYGTALSATQLSATASVAGTFAYTPAAGTVLKAGAQTLSATFTPTDTTDYTTATKTVTLTVNKAALTVTANNASRAYGAANPTFTDTITGFVNGDTQSVVTGTASLTTTATTTSTVGTYPITAAMGTLSASNYTFSFAVGTLTVNKATPVITWAPPTAITYGTALSSTQLNATSPAAGTFAYTPVAGTVLKAGPQTLSVTLTPTDSTNYTTATATVSLTVNKATPTITWATPSAITYGTALSATQLDATSPVAGTSVYTPALGAVVKAGAQTLSVTLTPTDSTDYTTATATVSLTVNKATPSVTWATPVAITYGTALSATQLDATSPVAGTFVYTPAAGTVLKAGAQTLSVTLTPTDSADYTTSTLTVSLTVNKATPTITWATPAAITYGAALSGTQLNATSPVAGTFAYAPAAGTVLMSGAQTLSVTLTPTDATDYTAATKTVTLTVNKATLTVTANNASRAYGAANPTLTDTITGFVNGDTLTVVTGAASLTTAATTTSTVGTYPITAALGTLAASNYSFSFVNGKLTVTQATPTITWATPAAITYGTALSATQLSATASVAGTFAYTPAAGRVLAAGTQTLSATFTPTDATDYTTATKTVTLTVNKATLTVTATNASRAYGAANPTFTDTITGFVNGDAQSVATGAASLTTTATTTSTVGTYPITAALGTLAASNYSFTFANGTLTIGKATLTATANNLTSTYGAALPSLTYATSGFMNGDTAATAITGSPSLTTTATSTSAVGSYPITIAAGTLAATNYTFQFVNGTLTIVSAPVPAPVFTPTAGTYLAAQTVTISDTVTGATIYYTTNGTTPTTSSTKYTAPITVGTTEMIEAIATAPNYSQSAVASATYTITLPAATPTFSPAAGTYSAPQTVTISDGTTGATVYYTTNGTTPTTGSTKYTAPITVSATETIQAIAVASGYSTSAAGKAAYSITAAPVASVSTTELWVTNATNTVYLFDGAGGSPVGTLSTPGGVTRIAQSPTDIFLLNPNIGSVYDFTPNGVQTGTPISSVSSQTFDADAITIGPDGNFYIALSQTNQIVRYDKTGKLLGVFGTGPTNGSNHVLDGMVFGPSNLFVADFIGQQVLKYALTGGSPSTVSVACTGQVDSLAIGVNGDLYGSNLCGNTVYDITKSSVFASGIGGGFLRTIQFRPDGYLYMAAQDAGAIYRASATSGGTPAVFAKGGGLTNAIDFAFVPSSSSLTFGRRLLNTTASPISVQLSNTGNAPLTIASVALSGVADFTQTNNCGQSVNAGATCTVQVSFTPSAVGSRTATLTITDNSGGVSGATQTISVSGTGLQVPVAATPTFSPAAGTYTTAQTVTISDATAGATIYYTTNGTTPTTSSTKYTAPITVSATETVEAIATAPTYAQSAVASATYAITPPAAMPTFSPAAGTYTSAQTVTISDATAGATIYYTTNGTTPTTSSTKYTAPITVSATETLEAIATAANYSQSAVASAAYTITPLAAAPTFSPAAGTYTSTQTVTISDATAGATVYYTTNGTTPTTSSTKYTAPITVSATETLEAIATAANYTQSAVASATYTITPTITPTIIGVSAIAPQQTQTISITGSGFGSQATYTGNSNYIILYDVTQGNWSAGQGGDAVGLVVNSWTDTQIQLGGFSGSYGSNNWSIQNGDSLVLSVWNASTGAGPASCSVTVGGGPASCAGWLAGGIISAYAGNGTGGFSGDGGQAPSAQLYNPLGMAIDGAGNLYIADTDNARIRKVTANGVISTVVGTGVAGSTGDGGPALNATLNYPEAVTLDASGNLYIVENNGCRVRKVAAATGIISTVAGTGTRGETGDGGPATSAELYNPKGVAVDTSGNIYISDYSGNRVRKVTASTGVISTFAGTGTAAYSGDGGPAASAGLYAPEGLVFDANNNLYIADSGNFVVRKVTPSGTISTVAGVGQVYGYNGDGKSATQSWLAGPSALALDSAGNLYIADNYNFRTRKVNSAGIISTVAGTGANAYGGNGGVATSANLENSWGLALDKAGNLYISDFVASVVRKVSYNNTGAPPSAPAFAPAGGTYTAAQTVTITDSTPGVTIYYATSGATTTNWTKYSTPISVTGTTTVQAVAIAANSAESQSSAVYNFLTSTPTISPTPGTYTSAQTVTLSDATSGAVIYYTTDGYYPTTSSTQYTAPFKVSASAQVFAMAQKPGYSPSALASVYLTINLPSAAVPVITPAAGKYSTAQTVTITDSTPNATIYYSTDGTSPGANPPFWSNSKIYTGAFTVSSPVVVSAIAIAPGFGASAYATQELQFSNVQASLLYTVAGSSNAGYSGDGGPATVAQFNSPQGLAKDSAGNLYIADTGNNRIRKVAAGTGLVTTIAGTGTPGYSGDGGPATAAQLSGPRGLALDSSGNLYISDQANMRVRKITASTGVISTVASVYSPSGLAMDNSGNIYVADPSYSQVHKIAAGSGTVTTVAGTWWGYSGDGGPATSAQLAEPEAVGVDAAGNLYIADTYNGLIRKVTASTGIITTVAGNTTLSGQWSYGNYNGDGQPAIGADLSFPNGVAVDAAGNIYIADTYNERIRKVTASTGLISTVAGNTVGFDWETLSGDGNPGAAASLYYPQVVTVDNAGNVYFGENGYPRVRALMASALPPASATAAPSFSVAAGTYAGPQTVTISDSTAGASLYVTLDGTTPTTTSQQYFGPINVSGPVTINALALAPGHLRSSVVTAKYTISSPAKPTISTYAGSGLYGFSGFGGPAAKADFGYGYGIAFDTFGNLYMADVSNSVVWKITAATGNATIIAGNGLSGFSGDGGSAVNAELDFPEAIAIDKAGNVYIADNQNYLVRMVSAATGIISTIAGNGDYGYSGDGGPATRAGIEEPTALALDSAGNLYIASSDHVRKVTAATGIITTVAGSQNGGTPISGASAINSKLSQVNALAVDSGGNIYISTTNLIWKVNAATGILTALAGNGSWGDSGDGLPAINAEIYVSENGMAIDPSGNVYIACANSTIRKVNASTGVISTIAGSGYSGFWGDGGSAGVAQLAYPTGIALDASGNLYMNDANNLRVRKLTF
jgi:MBG domain (YGX type)/Chitobiase/beta-hexosaminidase C-terminal domain/FG-GAP-like repeat/Abnormal spindle-like microcephaly-assoc'd, ASPM-SPD-2-Hydin/NHL repeat